MNARRAPTLSGRVMAALLLAAAVVCLVLVAVDYASVRLSLGTGVAMKSASEALGEALDGVDDGAAAAIARASEIQFNRSRRDVGLDGIEDLLFRIERRDGRPVYASAGLGAQAPIRSGPVSVAGKPYHAEVRDTGEWRIVLLEPDVTDGRLLRWLGLSLVQPMLIALPLLLLPLWWSVRRGLKPLRGLVAAVQARRPDDMAPLDLDLRYAELQPIVAALNDLLARARDGIARERSFLQDAAHELRTPMAVVSAQAHALASAEDAATRDIAKAALERAVVRSSHLVHQLLSLARLDGLAAREPRWVDLVALARDTVIGLTPLADARGIEIRLQSPDTLPACVATDAVHSILENLLQNALKYCPAGSLVDVVLASEGGQVSLGVCDDGPGVCAHDPSRAFDRFHRGRDVVAFGAGLGLAIVREAALCLGGTASLQDGPAGRGLCVRVMFPSASVGTGAGSA